MSRFKIDQREMRIIPCEIQLKIFFFLFLNRDWIQPGDNSSSLDNTKVASIEAIKCLKKKCFNSLILLIISFIPSLTFVSKRLLIIFLGRNLQQSIQKFPFFSFFSTSSANTTSMLTQSDNIQQLKYRAYDFILSVVTSR